MIWIFTTATKGHAAMIGLERMADFVLLGKGLKYVEAKEVVRVFNFIYHAYAGSCRT